MRLVLLPFLDRGVSRVEIFIALEALDGLRGEVAVRHRVAKHCDAPAGVAEEARDVPRRLALPRPRAHRTDRNDRPA